MVYIGRSREFLLHLGAGETIFHRALALRHKMTESETILWNELKNRKFNGLKFRRQHPVQQYIADFYCHEKRLIIEVDGEIHNGEDQKERDLNRSTELDRLGIKVIRFSNEEVLNHIDHILIDIAKQVENPSRHHRG